MNDTERIDKLQRMEIMARGRKWFGVANENQPHPGTVITWPMKRALQERSVDRVAYDNIREAIDAAPEPKRRKPR